VTFRQWEAVQRWIDAKIKLEALKAVHSSIDTHDCEEELHQANEAVRAAIYAEHDD